MKLHLACLVVAAAACGAPASSVPSNTSAAAPVAWTPRTACVSPAADAASRIADHFQMVADLRASLEKDLAPSATPDLDGDGTADAIFAYAPGEVPLTLLYVTRGSCAHLVGEATGRVEPQSTRTKGWPDLLVTNDGAAEATGGEAPSQISKLAFDGTQYTRI